MRLLFIDLSPGLGGSLVSLERLLPHLEPNFDPVLLLAAGSPGVARFRATGVDVITVATPNLQAFHSTRLVARFKESAGVARSRTGPGLGGWLWSRARALRNVALRTTPLCWRILRAIRSADPDLVHVNDAIFVNRPAIAASWLARRKTVCHVRSLGRLTALDRALARTLRGCVFISRWVEADMTIQGVACARSRLIYDGVDLGDYVDLPDRRTAREALGLPPHAPVVAVIGRLVPWKGQDLFIRAMVEVLAAHPNALGLVVGEPEVYSLDYEPALKGMAADLGIADRVRFTGFVDDPRALLRAIDVLAHTSTSPEPFGLVMIEAMAAGIPVVTPAEGGGAEIVLHGETGLHFVPRDPTALASAILDLLGDAALRDRLGSTGRARARSVFDVRRFAREMMAYYRELID